MPGQYQVLTRPCSDERSRYRYTLVTTDGAAHIHSQASFGSRQTAQRVGELQATKLARLAALLG